MKAEPPQTAADPAEAHLRRGKRRRRLVEALTGYVFVLPAAIITFVFGLWPVVMGFYESLKSGSPLTNRYVGLANYVRSLGSLTYVILFALSVLFLFVGYRTWRSLYNTWGARSTAPWLYMACGVAGAMGLLVLTFDLVTGAEGIGWASAILLLGALAGYYATDRSQSQADGDRLRDIGTMALLIVVTTVVWVGGPLLIGHFDLGLLGWLALVPILGFLFYHLLTRLSRINTAASISTSLITGVFVLLAFVIALFAAQQMQGDVAQAQRLAQQIFNQNVLNARVDVTDDGTRIAGLTVDEPIMVEVNIGGETVEAQLAPDAFPSLSVDRITRLETALANNQRVKVILPDGSEAEGELTGLPMGERLDLSLLAEDPRASRTIQIYTALDVGEAVIRARGYTPPLRDQMLATLGALVAIGNIGLMVHVRRKLPEDARRARRWLEVGCVVLGAAVAGLFIFLLSAVQLARQAASALDVLTEDQFRLAYQYVTGAAPRANLRSDGLAAQLLYWPQVLLMGTGAVLIGAAYLVWQGAQKRETALGFGLTIFLAIALMVGGWLTISELSRAMGMAGRDMNDTFDALGRTAMYALGTVPVQLVLGLCLAYLLFSEITWGKSLFRVIYFMPYIAPSVATAAVFLVIFSLNDNSLANKLLGIVGIDPLLWLNEPAGVVRIFYDKVLGGDPLHIPPSLAGPSLALFTVIIYNIWVFAGYNAVIFLAGLGAIPGELYEAAEVDGAGRWSRFRHITVPLLSPTTFFLTMLSIIGTFKAFTHIYVLRGQAVGQEVDTMSIYIFNQLYAANDPGYAAALAFILFGAILVLTMTQNKLSEKQVFYG